MIRIGIVGCQGRMGSEVGRLVAAAADLALAAGVERPGHPGLGSDYGTGRISAEVESVLAGVDVLVDFALPQGIGGRALACAAGGKPYVCGVTGIPEDEGAAIRRASEHVPVVRAPNFAIGVNVLYRLARAARRLLGPDYDAEVVELHHRGKLDAPSGTARRIAELLSDPAAGGRTVCGREGRTGPKDRVEVGIHAVRSGDVVGEHTVVFGGPGERIELTHRAASREAFARGVLQAVRFAAAARPGLYSMDDVLDTDR